MTDPSDHKYDTSQYVDLGLHPIAKSFQAENERLRAALQFYADAWRYKLNNRYGGLEWSPEERLLDDCGNIAKEALRTK